VNWHERMNIAIDYIEGNLCGAIDFEYIAKITYQSVASFQRTFSVVTEMSISEYIRRRRMSIAAYEIKNSYSKVIDISMKYGYESPEAFTRAFKEIYGLSPSAARKEGVSLKPFSRISFLLTLKGDVVMDCRNEDSAVKIVNMYYEHMPALRLIGKRYTPADLDMDMKLDSKWNEWFQNGWFGLLNELGCLPGHEFTAVFGINIGNGLAYWIGMFFPGGTSVPEGFEYVEIPAGVMGMCWVHGYRENGELFSQRAHDLCLVKLKDAGNNVKMDFDGIPCKWSFERYHNERFFKPDSEGKVILDYGIYLVESEVNEQKLTDKDMAGEYNSVSKIDKSSQKHLPEMIITSVGPYSVDAESNLFICALSTLFLKLENFDEATPYFCKKKHNYCVNCGECGEMSKRSNLAKHHMDMYHYLLTATGMGLMWGDPNEAGAYDMKYIKGISLPLMEDRLDFAMKIKGFEYICIDKMKGEVEIFRLIKDSISRNMPVLIKLGDGSEWCVVTGVDVKNNTIYGLDSRNHFHKDKATTNRYYTEEGLFIITDWIKDLQKMVVITGKTDNVIDFNSILERMTGQLMLPERSVLETTIPRMLDSVVVNNARGVAEYLNQITGYAIEARWHAAECLSSILPRNVDSENSQEQLRECGGIFLNTHDTCWQIWVQLGIGPHTNYKLANLISQMMQDVERQGKLKSLFAQILDNDRIVLEKLQKLLSRS